MAIGDDAVAAGYAIVPSTGTGSEVNKGAQEINRTRDYIALVKALISIPWSIANGGTGATTVAGVRTNLGLLGAITRGVGAPAGGADGDIYFKYVP